MLGGVCVSQPELLFWVLLVLLIVGLAVADILGSMGERNPPP
jgi:hypothetical protein